MRVDQSETQTGIVSLHSERYETGSRVDGGRRMNGTFYKITDYNGSFYTMAVSIR